MSITQEELNNLTKNLSKLENTDEKLLKDVNWILSYIDLLNQVDTSWVKQTISVVEKENKLKEDTIIDSNNQKELLSCSKSKVINNQIAIDNIMK